MTKKLNAHHEIFRHNNFWQLAQEKPTRGKPIRRERVLLLLGNLQQNLEIFRPTYLNPKEKNFG